MKTWEKLKEKFREIIEICNLERNLNKYKRANSWKIRHEKNLVENLRKVNRKMR